MVFVRVTFALALSAAPACGQTAPKTVEPSQMPLAADKHSVVREHIRRAKVPEAKADAPVIVGTTVPDDVELWGLPQDSVTEVPTVTSYKFFHVGRTIAVVDPESRKVVQILRN
jgi:Protein of unknown function (DUF1236)